MSELSILRFLWLISFLSGIEVYSQEQPLINIESNLIDGGQTSYQCYSLTDSLEHIQIHPQEDILYAIIPEEKFGEARKGELVAIDLKSKEVLGNTAIRYNTNNSKESYFLGFDGNIVFKSGGSVEVLKYNSLEKKLRIGSNQLFSNPSNEVLIGNVPTYRMDCWNITTGQKKWEEHIQFGHYSSGFFINDSILIGRIKKGI